MRLKFLDAPDEYVLGNYLCRSVFNNGGCDIMVKNNINFKVLKVDEFCFEKHFEVIALLLTDINIIVDSKFKSPNRCFFMMTEKDFLSN